MHNSDLGLVGFLDDIVSREKPCEVKPRCLTV